MDDEDTTGTLREWLERAVDAITDAAKNGISSDDCKHTGTSTQC